MNHLTISLTFTARGYELDSYGHINNAVYLNYFEHARWEFFRALGLLELLEKLAVVAVVTDIHVRYQREVRIFDELKVDSQCRHEGPYLVFQQKLLNCTTGLQAARAETKLIFIDGDRMPQDIPTAILDAINPRSV
ncbi:MAG: acyl-CoA thioesterase [Bacteroidales bacterium]|nr:acyl-CoA thioesterase [Bacteroidales bacterium]